MNKNIMSVVALVAMVTTATADEFGIGVPLFSYRSTTPVVREIPQDKLPVYQPGVPAGAQQAPTQAPAQTTPTPVYLVQPDGTLKLVSLSPAPVVVAPPPAPAKRKEILIRPGITFFRTREW